MSDVLEVWLSDRTLIEGETRVGTLTRSRGRGGESVRFEYAPNWLDSTSTPRAFQLDPDLPLMRGAFHPPQGWALHGIFLDMAPDRWGRVLMERREAIEAKDEKRTSRVLRDWDFLTGVNDATRMGGLRLWDPAAQSYVDARGLGAPPLTRLRELEDIVARLEQPGVEELPEYRQWLRMLVLPGTSLGGARPKASFTDEDGSMWIAKFPASEDRRDVGLLEFMTSQLAMRAAIDMPVSRRYRFSPRGHTFAVKRFDRDGGDRRVYASAMGLLRRRDGEGGSYLDLVELIETIGDPAWIRNDLAQLYRRIVFSLLIGNRDDHLRNHGFLRSTGGWRLSPAFDINPNPDKDVHALAIDADDARPATGHLLATCDFYRLKPAQARMIHGEVRAALAGWHAIAAELKVGNTDLSILDKVIDIDL